MTSHIIYLPTLLLLLFLMPCLYATRELPLDHIEHQTMKLQLFLLNQSLHHEALNSNTTFTNCLSNIEERHKL